MKKFFILFAVLAFSLGAMAADVVEWTVTSFSGSIANNATTINGATWTLSNSTVGSNTNGAPAWAISSKKWKFGTSKSQFWSSYTISTEYFATKNISKIEIGCYDNGGTTSTVTAVQGSVTIGTATVSTTTTTNVETLNANAGEGGTLSITYASSAQASYITSITVYTDDGNATVNVTGVSLDQSTLSLEQYKTATLVATITPADATNQNVAWASDNEAVAKVSTTGVVKALSTGSANITVTTADGSKTATCAVTVTPKQNPTGTTFFESFDQMNGAGGNDGLWSSITGTYDLGSFDNTGWTSEGALMAGYDCLSIRKATDTDGNYIISGLTSPAIGVAGNGNVTFMAESWGTDGSNFFVDIVGGGTFVANDDLPEGNISNEGATAKVLMDKSGNWTTFNLEFEGLTAASQLRFYAPANKRAFLDEVAVYVTPAAAPAKFFLSVTGYDNDNNPVTVDMSIFAGLKFVVNLPESAHSTLGANRADVKVQLTDVEGLGISGTHTYTHTITTGVEGIQAVLATKLSNAYSFGEVSVPFTFTAGNTTKTFTYNIKREGNVITGTPSSTDDAKAAWDILMTKIDATGSNAANDAHFFFAKGSTFVLGNQRLTFVDDVTAALNGSSFSDIFATNDKVVIETLQGAAANTLQFYFATGSTVAVGSRTAKVKDVINFDVQNSVDLQTGYWSGIRNAIDGAAEGSEKKVAIHKFMDFANDLIGIVKSSTNLQAGVLAKDIELGDVNEDGIIDVTDITKVATSILNQDYTQPFNYWAADLELNGLYNVTDITRIANIIFGIEEE